MVSARVLGAPLRVHRAATPAAPGGTDTADCDDDCTRPRCGDAHSNAAAGETCDDGNETSGDGCSAACALEPRADAGGGTNDAGSHGDAGAPSESTEGGGCGCRVAPRSRTLPRGGVLLVGAGLAFLFVRRRRRA